MGFRELMRDPHPRRRRHARDESEQREVARVFHDAAGLVDGPDPRG